MEHGSDVGRAWEELSKRWDDVWGSAGGDEAVAARGAMRDLLLHMENALSRQQAAIESLRREVEFLRFRQLEPIVVGPDW